LLKVVLLLRIASQNGHINIVNRLLEYPEFVSNMESNVIGPYGPYLTLVLVASNGHAKVISRLLEYQLFRENLADCYFNGALSEAAEHGHIEVVNCLLKFKQVRDNVAICNNKALRLASQNGHIEVVKRLLAKKHDGSYEFPGVIQNIAAADNYALSEAAASGHYEIAYILARAGWPNGVKDIPQNLRECIPVIRKGEIMVNERDAEATQLFRWLQEGYIPTSRHDLYLPPILSSKELQETTTLDFDVMDIVNKYAGTQRRIDTSRPTDAELNMVSIRSLNLLKSSYSIMNHKVNERYDKWHFDYKTLHEGEVGERLPDSLEWRLDKTKKADEKF
jgi:ankyrin repeat protein